ncbi:MAG: Na/Pi cotransporter family protein [Bacteroidales bacterium]|nr:Na/Pi cotransporter family protein [Bacteroidales bacterium]
MNIGDIFIVTLKLAGALAVFLFAMKLMSEGLQKIAGSKMRSVLKHITGNPLSGILTGTAVTAAIQSSSATTVMVVSFVNAGLLSLAGAVAVIMGANIGTTITAWIITLFGLGDNAGGFSLPMLLATISLFFIFSGRDKMKSIGQTIIGLALLLVGMELLQEPMSNLDQYPNFLHTISTLSNYGFWSILIFIAIGALLTCLVQASAAMMAITLVMCYNGWIGFDVAVALVMGQNIGTTITANLAALVANAAGKKAARAHLVFNVVGVLITLIAFSPLMHFIAFLTENITGCSPYTSVDNPLYNRESVPMAISLFHTIFNVGNTIILAFFIPQIIKIVNWMVKSPVEETEDEFRLTYIEGNWLSTAELNLQSAKSEIEEFSKRVLRMYTFLPDLRTAKSEEEFDNIMKRISKYEDITDHMELEITKFLTRVGSGDVSQHASERISTMLRIIDNLESIGDAIYQIAMTRKSKREDAVHFDASLNANLAHMSELVQKALDVMDSNLKDYDHIDLDAAYEAEKAINSYRDVLRTQHLDALKLGIYDYSIGNAYSGLYALYEKLGDYVINVSEAIDNSRKIAENE